MTRLRVLMFFLPAIGILGACSVAQLAAFGSGVDSKIIATCKHWQSAAPGLLSDVQATAAVASAIGVPGAGTIALGASEIKTDGDAACADPGKLTDTVDNTVAWFGTLEGQLGAAKSEIVKAATTP